MLCVSQRIAFLLPEITFFCLCGLYICFCFRPWKFEHMATDLLALLLRDDHPLPPDAVLYFTQTLVHDSISIRKVCISLCVSYYCVFLHGVWNLNTFQVSAFPSGYKNGNKVAEVLFRCYFSSWNMMPRNINVLYFLMPEHLISIDIENLLSHTDSGVI